MLLSWPVRHPWLAVALVAGMIAAATVAVLRLRPDASLEGLLPRDSPSGAAVVRVLNDFALAEELLVLVTAPDGNAPADAPLSFARRLDEAVRSDPNLNKMAADVVYRADPETQRF